MRRGAMLALVLLWVLPGIAHARLNWSAPVFIDDHQQAGLDAISCPALSQCTAVDSSGKEATFDPSAPAKWTAYSIDRGAELLSAVACPSVSQCTAVDRKGAEVTFNPRSPGGGVRFAIDPGHGLWGIACPSTSQCTAVDTAGQELTFDPSATVGRISLQVGVGAQVGAGTLEAVACPSTTQCTAIDSGISETFKQGGPRQLVTFDPTSPGEETRVPLATLGQYLDCPSATECIATASQSCVQNCAQGETVTFDPTSTASPTPVTRGRVFFLSLACPSVSQCTAMDASGTETTFDPGAASNINQAFVDPVGDYGKGSNSGKIACPSTRICAVVAATEGSAEMTFDPLAPGKPPVVTIDDGATNLAITCPVADECIALARVQGLYLPGPLGASAAITPAGAKNPSGGLVGGGDPVALSCPRLTQCTFVTRRSAALPCCKAVTFNALRPGFNFRAGHPIDASNLTGISCPTEAQCTAVDVRGRQVTFDPRLVHHPPARELVHAALTAIACISRHQCVALDRAGQALAFDPDARAPGTPRRIDGHRALVNLSCPAATQCTAIDRRGFEITFDPTSAHRATMRRIDTAAVNSISCPTRRFCVAVDSAGRALQGDPVGRGHWSAATLPGAGPLLSVACPSTRTCVAVDTDGHAYTGRG